MAANINPLKFMQSPALKYQSGVLLIEVLVSILIFSIGILGVVGLQVLASKNSSNAESRTVASSLANDLVSQMWMRKTADPTNVGLAADIVTWQQRISTSALPNAASTVVAANGITTISITYRAPSKNALENTNQYITQVVIPQ